MEKLETELDALLILQGHLQRLDHFDEDHPLNYSFGLYQGNKIREKLKTRYLRQISRISIVLFSTKYGAIFAETCESQ